MSNKDCIPKKQYKNILVDAVMHLGDLIHATSIVTLLKKLYPETRVSFLVESGLVPLFDNVGGVEHVIPYHYKSGGDYVNVFRMGNMLKKYNFDLSISLDPRTRLAAMMWIAGIPTRVGSPSVFGWEPGVEKHFFTDFVDLGEWNCKEHPHAYNFQHLVKRFAKVDNIENFKPLFTPPSVETLQYVDTLLEDIPKDSLKIAMCVKTVEQSRNWQPKRFAELIRRVVDKHNAYFIIVGVKSDMDVVEQLEIDGNVHVINAVGKTNLKQLNALFNTVDFLINFDNGMGHFAAASGCPTLTMFTNESPLRFTPLHEKTMVLKSSYDCKLKCDKKNKKSCGFKCVDAITVDDVMDKVEKMIDRGQL